MITRPLEISSHLAPPPRNSDVLFYVNVGALALFFLMFGSRFVLAPALPLGGPLPGVEGARNGAVRTTCHLRILGSGQILTDKGLLTQAQLPEWLRTQSLRDKHAVLLLLAGVDVPIGEITRIQSMAAGAGFSYVALAAQESPSGESGRRAPGDGN
jgi:biopolymer transport protein ExbD